jgi:hypothetical protein
MTAFKRVYGEIMGFSGKNATIEMFLLASTLNCKVAVTLK